MANEASFDFLKTKILKLQTNTGDPKLFKLEKRPMHMGQSRQD